MLHEEYTCPLCGEYLRHLEGSHEQLIRTGCPGQIFRNGSWGRQFRAGEFAPAEDEFGLADSSDLVYTDRDGVVLTGVGLTHFDGDYDKDMPLFIAPVEHWARWSDVTAEEQSFAVGRDDDGPQHCGRHGFAIHEACWCLLEQFWKPDKVPLQRLLDVCRSFPIPWYSEAVDWGHDYGRMYHRENRFPWDSPDYDGENPISIEVSPCCPMQTKELSKYLGKKRKQLDEDLTISFPEIASEGADDCFQKLPLELRVAITNFLPIKDALRARQASRAFVPIYYMQQFWASRFTKPLERSWLLQFRQDTDPSLVDWRLLYRQTDEYRIGPALENRKRIWGLIAGLEELLRLRWRGTGLNENADDLPTEGWISASCPVVEGRSPGDLHSSANRCLIFRSCCMTIPVHVVQVSVSYAVCGGTGYVTGLEITDESGKAFRCGYWGVRKCSVDLKGLSGLELAIGARGIHALRCLDSAGIAQAWLGQPEGWPKTRRLAVARHPFLLNADFDGTKLVSLAIHPTGRSPADKLPEQGSSDHALWYPEIPPKTCFPIAGPVGLGDRFNPLSWVHFGGPGGKYLHRLKSIHVDFCSGFIVGIDFRYDRKSTAPVKHRELTPYRRIDRSEVFTIDGAGGEAIMHAAVYNRQPPPDEIALGFPPDGVLDAFSIITNFGRCRSFTPCPNDSHSWIADEFCHGNSLDRLKGAPTSMLTGIYATCYFNRGWGVITNLGLISEPV